MAQHIRIIKIDELGEALEDIQVNFADIVNVLEAAYGYKKNYPWIATIDPYGDTIFNRIQMPFVIKDLKKLYQDKKDLLPKDAIDKLIAFLEKVDIHEYIKFIGD